MANAQRGQVAFEADGQEWVLRYTTNALCELETRVGISALDWLTISFNDNANPKLSDLRLAVWAGLVDAQPDVTLADVGALIDAVGFEPLTEKMGEAINLAFAVGEKKPGKPKAGASEPA